MNVVLLLERLLKEEECLTVHSSLVLWQARLNCYRKWWKNRSLSNSRSLISFQPYV